MNSITFNKICIYEMGESSPILPSIEEYQNKIHYKEEEEEVSEIVISKVAFETI